MPHLCPDCQRPNAPHREVCLYCGGTLPEPTAPPPARVEPNLPPDIDQLVKQAMTLGTTHKLREAMQSHHETPPESVDEPVEIDLGELLQTIKSAASDAVEAHNDDRVGDVDVALVRIQTALSQWGPIGVQQRSAPAEDEPIICLPKVRRMFGLVVEGVGDVERHQDFVDALGMDGATARMIAIARQPRVAMRGDDRERLEAMAVGLREKAGVCATVIEQEQLRLMGPAWLLHGFESGPTLVPIHDWAQAFETPSPGASGRPMTDAPLLVVPGEVVVLKYRTSRTGGRLKHLREGRMQAASEQRLALADLHTESGIVRILEGHTNLSDAPGTVEDGFRRSLRALIDNWREQGVRVLEPRTCSPSGQSGRTASGLEQAAFSTGWPDWEEHSRAAGALFSASAEIESLGELPDLPKEDQAPTSVD